jgi:hypothetical protein
MTIKADTKRGCSFSIKINFLSQLEKRNSDMNSYFLSLLGSISRRESLKMKQGWICVPNGKKEGKDENEYYCWWRKNGKCKVFVNDAETKINISDLTIRLNYADLDENEVEYLVSYKGESVCFIICEFGQGYPSSLSLSLEFNANLKRRNYFLRWFTRPCFYLCEKDKNKIHFLYRLEK